MGHKHEAGDIEVRESRRHPLSGGLKEYTYHSSPAPQRVHPATNSVETRQLHGKNGDSRIGPDDNDLL